MQQHHATKMIAMQHYHATKMIIFLDVGVLRSPECFATPSCSSIHHPLLTQVLDFLRFVSKAGAGSRGGGDRQFCYVNGRPVDLPRVCSQFNFDHIACTLPQSLTHSLTHAVIHSLTHAVIYSLTHSFIHFLTHPPTHHQPTHPPTLTMFVPCHPTTCLSSEFATMVQTQYTT